MPKFCQAWGIYPCFIIQSVGIVYLCESKAHISAKENGKKDKHIKLIFFFSSDGGKIIKRKIPVSFSLSSIRLRLSVQRMKWQEYQPTTCCWSLQQSRCHFPLQCPTCLLPLWYSTCSSRIQWTTSRLPLQ